MPVHVYHWCYKYTAHLDTLLQRCCLCTLNHFLLNIYTEILYPLLQYMTLRSGVLVEQVLKCLVLPLWYLDQQYIHGICAITHDLFLHMHTDIIADLRQSCLRASSPNVLVLHTKEELKGNGSMGKFGILKQSRAFKWLPNIILWCIASVSFPSHCGNDRACDEV